MPSPGRASSGRRRFTSRGRAPFVSVRQNLRAPEQKPLYAGVDHGAPVILRPEDFLPSQREGGWGAFAESFLKMNAAAIEALDVRSEIRPGAGGLNVRLVPGGRTGAVPLRSAQTGHVAGGFIVRPRFGWA